MPTCRLIPSPALRGYVFSVWHRKWGEALEPEGLTDLSPGRSPGLMVACTIQAL